MAAVNTPIHLFKIWNHSKNNRNNHSTSIVGFSYSSSVFFSFGLILSLSQYSPINWLLCLVALNSLLFKPITVYRNICTSQYLAQLPHIFTSNPKYVTSNLPMIIVSVFHRFRTTLPTLFDGVIKIVILLIQILTGN